MRSSRHTSSGRRAAGNHTEKRPPATGSTACRAHSDSAPTARPTIMRGNSSHGTARRRFLCQDAARCVASPSSLSLSPSPSPAPAVAAVDAGVIDAGPPMCTCMTSCCLPDGTCAPNNGIEACGPVKVFCGTCQAGQRCEQGVCVAGACSGCLDPLGACRTGREDATCGSDGGVCVSCGGDQGCAAGRCIFVRCDLTNCRFGCCQPDKTCVAPMVLACGLGGDSCQACVGTEQCVGGTCQ